LKEFGRTTSFAEALRVVDRADESTTSAIASHLGREDRRLSATYPYWLMIAGGLLVAFGFIGAAFRQNRIETALNDKRGNGTSGPETKQDVSGAIAKVQWSLPPPEL
jgi:hypothetical protein